MLYLVSRKHTWALSHNKLAVSSLDTWSFQKMDCKECHETLCICRWKCCSRLMARVLLQSSKLSEGSALYLLLRLQEHLIMMALLWVLDSFELQLVAKHCLHPECVYYGFSRHPCGFLISTEPLLKHWEKTDSGNLIITCFKDRLEAEELGIQFIIVSECCLVQDLKGMWGG